MLSVWGDNNKAKKNVLLKLVMLTFMKNKYIFWKCLLNITDPNFL